nr:hypothetical protein HK105_008361 [Polyrhizophydium stewartii]
MVVAHTTPTLSWFLRRPLLRAEVASLPSETVDRMWAEVFETDWQGDLGSLPFTDTSSACLLLIASRTMFDRMLAAGNEIAGVVTQRLAARHGWTDLMRFHDPEFLAIAAAKEGAVRVLEDLFDVRRLIAPSTDHVEFAAGAGHLELVQWLRSRMPGVEWPAAIMDAAAGSGNLDLWLAEKAQTGCPEHAFRWAAKNGHVEVLDFLRLQYPSVFAVADDTTFTLARHLGVLKWLKEHRPTSLHKIDLSRLLVFGDAEVVSWFVENTDHQVTQEELALAIERNCCGLVKWLVEQKGLQINAKMFEFEGAGFCTQTLAWIIRRDPRWARIMAEAFAASEHVLLVEWLHVPYPGSVTQHALETASRA